MMKKGAGLWSSFWKNGWYL